MQYTLGVTKKTESLWIGLELSLHRSIQIELTIFRESKTKQYALLLFTALLNVDRFSKFFHRRTLFPGNTLLPDVCYRTTCRRSGSKCMGEGWGQKWETLQKRLLRWEYECSRCMSNDVGFHRGVPHKFWTLRPVLLWFVFSALLPLYVVESRCHCRPNRVGEGR